MLLASAVLGNEFSAGVNFSTLDGFKGNQQIRTDPASVSGVAFAHIAQVLMAGPTDFVAIGTVKGAGTTGGIGNCTAHYDPGANWSGYYDRVISGVYNCQNFSANFWNTGDNPTFSMQYTYCPTIGNRWVMKFAGSQRTCISGPTSAIGVDAGLEVGFGDPPLTDRNIDVLWTFMQKHQVGGGWVDVGDTSANKIVDSNYSYAKISNSAWSTYLAPLD